MPDPFLVEQEYHNLRHLLGLLTGKRRRLQAILEFQRSFLGNSESAYLAAYSSDIAALMTHSISEADLHGSSQQFLADVRSSLQELILVAVADQQRNELNNAIAKVDEVIKVRETWLNERKSSSTPGIRSFKGEIFVPVVESEHLLNEPPRFAALRKVVVTVQRREKGDSRDRIEYSGIIDKRCEEVSAQDSIIGIARSVAARVTNRSFDDSLIVRCAVDGEGIIWGSSLELAVGTLIVAGVQRLMPLRYEAAFRSDLALTGCVGRDGHVEPVEEAGLKLKVQCCANSRIRQLIVPLGQREIAEHYVEHIAKQDNRLRIEILGVESIEDVFMNRRVSEYEYVSRARHLGRRIAKHRGVIVTSMLAIALLWVALLLYGPVDKNPSTAKYVGTVLRVMNKGGDILREIEVGEGNVQFGAHRNLLALADVNHDGTNELIYVLSHPQPARIICARVRSGDVLWQKEARKEFSFPNNPDRIDDRYRVDQIEVDDFDKDGTSEVLVLAKHDFFPSYLAVLDATTGRERSFYLNLGHITRFLASDIDSDGRNEVLITGTNNAFQGAFVGVLSAADIRGASPITTKYSVEGLEPANEIFYALIPETALGLLQTEDYSHGLEIYPDIERGLWSFMIADYTVLGMELKRLSANVYWFFNERFEPVGISTGSQYDLTCAAMVKAGKLESIPDRAYFADHMRRLQVLRDRRADLRKTEGQRDLEVSPVK